MGLLLLKLYYTAEHNIVDKVSPLSSMGVLNSVWVDKSWSYETIAVKVNKKSFFLYLDTSKSATNYLC